MFFRLHDSKPLLGKWLFHQTSIWKWSLGGPGSTWMPWCTDTSQSCISFIVSKDTGGEFFVQHHDTFGLPILRQVVGFPRNFLQYGVKPENRKNRNPASHGVLDNSHLHLVPRILVPQGVAQENQWGAGEVWRFFPLWFAMTCLKDVLCADQITLECLRPVPVGSRLLWRYGILWEANLLADKSQGRWSWEPNLKPKVVGDKDCIGRLDCWMSGWTKIKPERENKTNQETTEWIRA